MSGFVFLTEPPPPRGVAVTVTPGVRRLVAGNPGPMTYHGTNTYLIETGAGVVVLDPGPDDAAHVAAVLSAAGGAIAGILVSHSHTDHVGALAALVASTGAPVLRWQSDGGGLDDGGSAFGLAVLHTPGHASDHMCFARADGVVFTADHVMSFASSVVIPPDGDMAAYMAGLARMLAREDAVYLPGHGPPIAEPRAFVAGLLKHRQDREAAIVATLTHGHATAADLVTALYVPLDPRLRGAAEANVRAHLLKLRAEGRATEADGVWAAA